MFDLHHTAAVELLGISILSGKACNTYESRPISIMTNCCYSIQWQRCCGESLYIIVHCERCNVVKLHVLMPSSSLIYDFQKIYIKCSQNDMCKYICNIHINDINNNNFFTTARYKMDIHIASRYLDI